MFNNNPGSFGSKSSSIDIEGVILDAELLLKYRFVERAISTLEKAIEAYPKHIDLRDKLLEICQDYNFPDKGAEQAIALSRIYAESGDIERANDAIMVAKGFKPNLAINLISHQNDPSRRPMPMPMPMTSSQVSLRSLIRPTSRPAPSPAVQRERPVKIITGDLATVSIFDVIQMIENSRVTGILIVNATSVQGRIYFNYGQIADAQVGELRSNAAFRCFVELEEGRFEMEKSPVEFKQNINAPNNTNLILDILREVDEAKRDGRM